MDYKILIVDDIVINRMLLAELIKKLGYKYSQASNGQEALEKLKTDQIDLVLMDIEMPVMNGIETTKYIRENLVTAGSNAMGISEVSQLSSGGED